MTNRPPSFDPIGSRFPKLNERRHAIASSLLLFAVYLGIPALFYTSLFLVYRALT